MSEVKLYQGDCLEVIPTLEAESVDAILTDLPYGTTACSWDTVIPFADLWRVVKHILKPRGVFVTTASQPFTSALVMSNVKWFKYCWEWDKGNGSNPASVKNQPFKVHEEICVFSRNGHEYHPVKTTGKPYVRTSGTKARDIMGGGFDKRVYTESNGDRFPRSILSISNANQFDKIHPTQKPVALYEYLTLTYTNPGDTVLDLCAGSGTTGVACVKTGRNFIGIEKREDYYAVMERRIQEAQMQLRLELV